MSRKSKRNRPPPAAQPTPVAASARKSRAAIWAGAIVVVLVAIVAGAWLYLAGSGAAGPASPAKAAALSRDHAPTIGPPDARVHIVEFLDPACGTCAMFYPEVKKLMAANPGRIRLTVRHVAFHKGADLPVKILEASRAQGRYWQALETLLANQERWVVRHAVQADEVWPSLAGAGLDMDRAKGDIEGAEIARRIALDMDDARTLGVAQTPEYFVNGRPLPSFGLEELQALVRDELRRSYP